MNITKRNEKNPAYFAESEKIRQNRAKYGEKVHKFKAAEWTHPNGHPRCLLCGQEESISPECNREPTAEEHRAFQEKLDAEFGVTRYDVSPDGELVTSKEVAKAHFDPKQPRDPKNGEWVKVGRRLVRVVSEDTVPALGRGRKGRTSSASTKVSGKVSAKKKKVDTSPQMKQMSLSEQADSILGVSRRQRSSVDSTAASRVKRGTMGDATHKPIKVPTRSQIAAGKAHIKDNVPKKHEQYAGLVHRLATRGRVQSPEARKAAADKYGYNADDLFHVEKGIYDAMFGAAPTKTEHHTIKDAPPKVRTVLRNAGASHAMPDTSGDSWTYRDRDGNWHLVDKDGDVSDLSVDEAADEAEQRAQAWGEVDRENMSANEKRALAAALARRTAANRLQAEEDARRKAELVALADRMRRLGLDPKDPNQIRAYLGKLGVLGELDPQQDLVSRPRRRGAGKTAVTIAAADADKKQFKGQRPRKGRDTVEDGGTAAKSPRQRRVEKSHRRISKHGDPDTTPPGLYHQMHPNGRKTKWVKNAAQVERDHSAGWKFVAGDDGRDLTPRQARALVGRGGKPVYAYKPGSGDSTMNATARDRRARAAAEKAGEPKPKITRTRAKNDGAPAGFRDMTTGDMARFQKMGYKVPPKWTNLYTNESGPNKELLYVGTDEKGRRQYRYTKEWRASRNGGKFDKLKKITEAMPKLDARLKKDSKKDPTAGAVHLMRLTGMRVDSGGDTKGEVDAIGVTSLEVQHVKIKGNKVTFDFIGKKGVHNNYTVDSPELAALMRRWTEGKAPGAKVFEGMTASKTNAWIKQYIGIPEATNKDLRTFVATFRAKEKIATMKTPTTKKEINAAKKEVATYVAYYLSNDPAEAQSSYIDPSVYAVWGL